MKTLILFLTGCAAISAQTQKVALHRFGESDLLVIRTQKGFSTLIEFPPNHQILEATCGDKEFWVIEGKGRYLNIKPAKEGITTNLNVVLNGDIIYSFLLKEVTVPGGTQEPADFRVTVSILDEPTKARNDKDNIEKPAELTRTPKKEIVPDGEPKDGIDNGTKVGGGVVAGVTQAGTAPQDAHPAPTVPPQSERPRSDPPPQINPQAR